MTTPFAALSDAPAPVAEKPRRKGLSKSQIAWCRKHIPYFRDMESASKASKGGTAAPGKR